MPQSAAAFTSTSRSVGALGEIELHQPLFHPRRIAGAARPQDEAVAVERVRLARDTADIIR
jgi:hypothetical protein